MSTAELIDTVKRAGGVLELAGNALRCQLPKNAAHLIDLLRERKQELISALRARGGRIATFPHCPCCASYALYRPNNIGNYECLTCELQNIAPAVARRVH